MTRREMMMKSIEDKRAKQATQPPKPNPVPPPAKSAGKQKGKDKKAKKPVPAQVAPREPKPGEKPTKSKRTAKARDARMKTRGRLPVGASFNNLVWDGDNWAGELTALLEPGNPLSCFLFTHKAPGVFQMLEELDVMYWKKVNELNHPTDNQAGATVNVATPEGPK